MSHEQLEAIDQVDAISAAVLEAAATAVVVQDVSGRIIRWNRRALDLFHMSGEDLAGRNSIDPRWNAVRDDGTPLPGDLHPSMLVLQSGEPVMGFRMGVEVTGGSTQWLDVDSRPLVAADGSLIGAISELRDVSHVRASEVSTVADAERFRTAFERSPVALLIVDDRGRFIDANPALAHLFGRSRQEVRGMDWIALSDISEQLSRLLLPPFIPETEPEVLEYRRGDREVRFGITQLCAMRWPGAEQAAMVQITDITEQVESERQAKALAAHLDMVFDSSPVGMGLISTDGVFTRINHSMARMNGIPVATMTGESSLRRVHPDDRGLINRFASRALEGKPATVDHRICLQNGEIRWHRTQLTRIATPEADALLVQTMDHTAERRNAIAMRSIDRVTGLLSREGLTTVLEERILLGRESGEHFAVFCVDIDAYRDIVDRLGVRASDLLLEHVGVTMQAAMPLESVVARVNSDVFVGLAATSDEREAKRTVESIQRALASVTALGEADPIRCRFAAVVVGGTDVDPDLLLARVEQAAQLAGSEPQRFIVQPAGPPNDEQWFGEIEEALTSQRLLVVGEPIQPIDGQGELRRHELLVRLLLPGGVRVSMPRFERHATRLGVAGDVDRFVMRKGITMLAADPRAEIEVNLGLASVIDGATIDLLRGAVTDKGIDPSRMLLAINEQLVNDSMREVLDFAAEARELGFGLCIDNYWLSQQGIRLLETLGARRVKLSSDIVRDVGRNAADDGFVRATIRSAQELGVEVAVPYVTDEEAFERISVLGVDFLQGRHIGAAIEID